MSRKPVHATWLVIPALAAIMAGACPDMARATGNARKPLPPAAAGPAERQAALAEAVRTQVPAFAPDRVLVRFRPGTAAAESGKVHRQAGGRVLREIPAIGVQVIEVPRGKVSEKVAQYARNPNVLYAEPDFYRVLVIPDEGNDPGEPAGVIAGREYFEEQWGLNNTGQDHTSFDPLFGTPIQVSGAADADIDAPEGWDITTGDPSVKIAILDTGIDCDSVEHAGKCVEEISFVGAYSDYGDDPADYVGHGTHVAGIAAVHTDNGIGVSGVGWNSSLGNLKTCFAYEIDLFPPYGLYGIVGVCPVSASTAAITHAADNGYHVVNMSYGSDELDGNGDPVGPPAQPNSETAAISYAWSQGVVLIAAAGNDNNTTRIYPAANDEVIAVGATNHFDDRASFSTFSVPGDHWVSLLAPGEDILSTNPVADCIFYAEYVYYIPFDPATEGCVVWHSGTSMASPHVAGAAALVWAHLFPGQSPQGCTSPSGVPCNAVVRSHLEYGADSSGALTQNFHAWSEHGRLNVQGALSIVDTDLDGLPDAVDDDDDNDGLSDSFEINYAPVPPDTYTPGQDLNPLSADTDGDGLNDGDEIAFGSDPLVADTADGDVNIDGVVNAADVLLATRALTGAISLNVVQLLHADMVTDATLNTGDLVRIQQTALSN